MWGILSGSTHCHTTNNGACITDGVGYYSRVERCTVVALQTLFATATYFDTESYFDEIIIGTTSYSGSSGPRDVIMRQGQKLYWMTDPLSLRLRWLCHLRHAAPRLLVHSIHAAELAKPATVSTVATVATTLVSLAMATARATVAAVVATLAGVSAVAVVAAVAAAAAVVSAFAAPVAGGRDVGHPQRLYLLPHDQQWHVLHRWRR